MGANVNCQATELPEFAIPGTVVLRKFHGIENPAVALVKVGAEDGKGNAVGKEAYGLLKESDLGLVGNVEGMDIPDGKANVIVCDGFVGNVLLSSRRTWAEANNAFSPRISRAGFHNRKSTRPCRDSSGS